VSTVAQNKADVMQKMEHVTQGCPQHVHAAAAANSHLSICQLMCHMPAEPKHRRSTVRYQHINFPTYALLTAHLLQSRINASLEGLSRGILDHAGRQCDIRPRRLIIVVTGEPLGVQHEYRLDLAAALVGDVEFGFIKSDLEIQCLHLPFSFKT